MDWANTKPAQVRVSAPKRKTAAKSKGRPPQLPQAEVNDDLPSQPPSQNEERTDDLPSQPPSQYEIAPPNVDQDDVLPTQPSTIVPEDIAGSSGIGRKEKAEAVPKRKGVKKRPSAAMSRPASSIKRPAAAVREASAENHEVPMEEPPSPAPTMEGSMKSHCEASTSKPPLEEGQANAEAEEEHPGFNIALRNGVKVNKPPGMKLGCTKCRNSKVGCATCRKSQGLILVDKVWQKPA